ncbi:MAG: CBS domain-containing protein [Candidatus Helarchaeota archaeon]
MKKKRIEIEKFINAKGKIIFFGEKKPLCARDDNSVLNILKEMTKKDKRVVILTGKDKYRITGIVATDDLCHFLLKGKDCKFCDQFPSHYHQMYEQPIATVMTKSVMKIQENVPLFIAVRIMVNQNRGTLPIIDKHGDLKGIITERHIAFLLADTRPNLQVKVQDIMTSNVITCHPNCTIGDVLHTICEKGFRRLPIVEGDTLVGYVTIKDLLRYFTRPLVVKSFQNHEVEPIFNEKISTIMVSSVITISPEESITDCAKKLKEKNIGALPVVQNEKLIGIITEHDIVEAMAIPE